MVGWPLTGIIGRLITMRLAEVTMTIVALVARSVSGKMEGLFVGAIRHHRRLSSRTHSLCRRGTECHAVFTFVYSFYNASVGLHTFFYFIVN
jgi:hypothetical protein